MICRPACCLALASSCWASLIAQDAVPPSAPVAPPRPAVRIVDLSGSPKERGEVHGRVLKDEIQRLVRAWKAGLRQSQGVEPDEFIKRFIAGTRFTAAIDKWTPGLLDEVRGIAAGSGIDFDTLYVFNLMDEVWAQGRQVVAHKCTAIGVDARDRQPTIVAQNLDLPVVFHGTQTVLRITAGSGLQTLVVTVPGLVGANGINSARVATGCRSRSWCAVCWPRSPGPRRASSSIRSITPRGRATPSVVRMSRTISSARPVVWSAANPSSTPFTPGTPTTRSPTRTGALCSASWRTRAGSRRSAPWRPARDSRS
jgi:hypothetical protein